MNSKRNAAIKRHFRKKYEGHRKAKFEPALPQEFAEIHTMPMFNEDFESPSFEEHEDEGEKWVRGLIEQHKRER